MRSGLRATLSLAVLTAGGAAQAQAAATVFHLKPIVLQGDDNFNATYVNAKGVIVGTLYAGITDDPGGVEIDGTKVTNLPAPAGFAALNPRVINDNGAILGWSRGSGQLAGTFLFLYNDGSYDPAYGGVLIYPGSNISNDMPLQMQLTNDLEVSFSSLIDLTGPIGAHYGKPPNLKEVPAMNRFTHINSVFQGNAAGNTYSFSGISTVYLGVKGKFTAVTPPNSRSAAGGYLNSKGALAGNFEDSSGRYHGFVYQGGAFTVFDMPVAASKVTVNAINDRGRVVGSYTSSNGVQHGFLYNGNTVTGFGSYPSSDNVTLAIGNNGAIVLSAQIPASEPKFLSYRVVCDGSGC